MGLIDICGSLDRFTYSNIGIFCKMQDTWRKMQVDLESIEFYFKEENLLIPNVNFVSEQGTLNGIKIILYLVSCILFQRQKIQGARCK